MTVDGGFDFTFNRSTFNYGFAWRVVQTKYLYTHFGRGCELAVCSGGNSQDTCRLRSGSS
jgi:hypothetical protein